MPSQGPQDAVATSNPDLPSALIVEKPIGVTISLVLAVGVLAPAFAIVVVMYSASARAEQQITQIAEETLAAAVCDKLITIREARTKQIQDDFGQLTLDLQFFARSEDVVNLFTALREYHDLTGVKPDGPYDVTTPEYRRIWQETGANIYRYCKDTGVPDMFMICADHGHVMYSYARAPNLGTNLAHGAHQDGGLARLWAQVKSTGEIGFVDFTISSPGSDQPAAFLGVPIPDTNGTLIGVMAIQVPLDEINAVMQPRNGLGETGETYLVGADKLMRSDSVLDPKAHSVAASFHNPSAGSVDSEAVNAALNGETGTKVVTSYLGTAVLSAYAPLDVYGNRWAILAEIDETEALAAAEPIRQQHAGTTMWLVAWAAGLCGLSMLAVALVSCGIHRMIARPIRLVAETSMMAANGDFSVRVPTSGRSELAMLGQAVNRMIGSLQRISSAGNKMVAACRKQAAGAQSQSTATAEMSSTVAELAMSAQKMSENGGAVAEQAQSAAKECNAGSLSVQNATHRIKGIHERVEKIAEHMLNLGGKSQQISGILDIIIELSEQTNLLSLNASIEAAGAGEAGRRFAVVASEIRKLAERATDSTVEIRSLIDSIQETVNTAIMATEEGSKSVQEGVSATEEVNESFQRIAEQVTSTAEAAKAIEMGNRQQGTAIRQMEETVRNLDTAAQQSEATARQVDVEAETLLGSTRQLQAPNQPSQVA